MKFELGYTLSEDAIFAKGKVKNFISTFEPYFAQKLADEKQYALAHHNSDSFDTLEFYNQVAIRGGKRIRASLAHYTYKMLGGKNDSVALELARAIEMIHAYLLIIDDFTDKSLTRRGGPTGHVLAETYFNENPFVRVDPYHHGASMAITAALLQLHRAEEVILGLCAPADIRIKISQNLNSKIATTAYGQITDSFNSLKTHVKEADVLDMLEWKTGVYTFENPIHSGALLAGAVDAELAQLTEYAIPTGIAFQIHDDVIGMFGNSEETGKSDKDDLMEGKMTLLIQHALLYATKDQIATINAYLGKKDLTDQEHAIVQQILIDCGSFEYSKQMAKRLVEQGKKALDKTPENWDTEGIDFLRGVADYVIQRSS
jgi:geranylgeranyl diphosphate synthase type I